MGHVRWKRVRFQNWSGCLRVGSRVNAPPGESRDADMGQVAVYLQATLDITDLLNIKPPISIRVFHDKL